MRRLQSPGTNVFAEMVERFGSGIVAADGTLDRQAVAEIVFNDEAALADLGAIVHPRVHEEIERRVAEQVDTDNVVVLDIPLCSARPVGRGCRDDRGRPASRHRRFALWWSTGVSPKPTHWPASMPRSTQRTVGDGRLRGRELRPLEDLETEIERFWEWIGSLESNAERPARPGSDRRPIGALIACRRVWVRFHDG